MGMDGRNGGVGGKGGSIFLQVSYIQSTTRQHLHKTSYYVLYYRYVGSRYTYPRPAGSIVILTTKF